MQLMKTFTKSAQTVQSETWVTALMKVNLMSRYIFQDGKVYVEEVKFALSQSDIKSSITHDSVVLILTNITRNSLDTPSSNHRDELVKETAHVELELS